MLPVVFTVILPRERRAIKRFHAPGQVNVVFSQVRATFAGVVVHAAIIVYTLNGLCKSSVSQGGPNYAFKPTAGESLVPTKRCRPDFAIALYPGHLCRSGTTFDPGIKVTRQTPPTVLLQAWDDPVDKICNGTLYARALDDAGVPAEIHFFAKGGHAFGLRPYPHPVSAWPALVENWLLAIGITTTPP